MAYQCLCLLYVDTAVRRELCSVAISIAISASKPQAWYFAYFKRLDISSSLEIPLVAQMNDVGNSFRCSQNMLQNLMIEIAHKLFFSSTLQGV